MTDEFSPYDANQGWEYSIYNWKGRDLISMKSFEPSSQSLGYIWYAPDHVRSWRSNVYKEIGGHNPELSVCDDHELCIRTYLHTKMKRIPEVLYIYRITGENTWLERNQEIQQKTIELFNNYIQLLAEKDCEEKGLLKIDLGGGLNPYKDYKTVDITESADFQYDLNEGIPLPDNSVGVINASHILEHLKDPIKSMSEIHRVLCHGGWAFIEIPSTDGRGAFQDPTHVSFWNENSFLYYTDKYLANFINNKYIRFQEYYKQTYFPNEWLQQINVCVTSAYLTVIKDDSIRYPGFLKI
jgi:SAM-dependent methyltransferase